LLSRFIINLFFGIANNNIFTRYFYSNYLHLFHLVYCLNCLWYRCVFNEVANYSMKLSQYWYGAKLLIPQIGSLDISYFSLFSYNALTRWKIWIFALTVLCMAQDSYFLYLILIPFEFHFYQ
jgi:hypothetical protein